MFVLKNTIYEAGIKVQFIVCCPKEVKLGISDVLVSHIDLYN